MYPDAKTFWISAAFMFACGIGVIAIGHVWLGVVTMVFVALGVVMFFVRKSKGQIPDKRFGENHAAMPAASVAAPAPLAMPAREPLSEAGLAEAERVLQALHGVGIIAPDVPPLAQLQEALVDYGEPVDMVAVLSALLEAHYYHADFAEDRYFANLRFHAEQIEQFAETLHVYFDDMCALAQVGHGQVVRLECSDIADAPGRMRVVATLVIGDQTLEMEEVFFSKYLNAAWYVRIARALAAAGAPRRLAWLYDESGIWLSGLAPETDLRILPAAEEGWRWVDEGVE